jgi:hypothetical protein
MPDCTRLLCVNAQCVLKFNAPSSTIKFNYSSCAGSDQLNPVCVQEMEETLTNDSIQKVESKKEAKLMAKATQLFDEGKLDRVERKVVESKLADVKTTAETGAKGKAGEEVSAKIQQGEATTFGLKFIAQTPQIADEFAKEIEKLRMETDIRFQNISRRFERMMFVPVALIICCFILLYILAVRSFDEK